MNARLTRTLTALAALLVAAMLLIRGPGLDLNRVPQAASDARDRHGLSAFSAWLTGSGIKVHSFRKRMRDLAEDHDGSGQLLVLAAPLQRAIRAQDAGALKQWLEQGNSLLLLARHADAVSLHGVEADIRTIGEALGFKLRERDRKNTRAERIAARQLTERRLSGEEGEETVALSISGAQPILQGVQALNVKALKPITLTDRLSVSSPSAAVSLLLAHPKFGQLGWYFRTENARAVVLGIGGLASNSNLDRADNALLLRNVVRLLSTQKGGVIFADYYQGRSDLYDPQALLRDPRLHATVLILLALWLSYLLLVERRLLPSAQDLPPAAAHELKTLARLIARHSSIAERARGLLHGEFARGVLPNAPPQAVLQILATDPRVRHEDLALLRQADTQPPHTEAELSALLAAISRIEHLRR